MLGIYGLCLKLSTSLGLTKASFSLYRVGRVGPHLGVVWKGELGITQVSDFEHL